MGHSIAALVVPASVAGVLRGKGFTHLRLVGLEQGFYLVPITDLFLEEVESRYPVEGERYDEFWMLSPPLAELAADVSHSAPVAYVETDYFGGTGSQAAMAWKEDRIILGPRKSKWGVINEALYLIGVQRVGESDAFDTLGLGGYRTESDCLEAAESESQPVVSPSETPRRLSLSRRLTDAVRKLLRRP